MRALSWSELARRHAVLAVVLAGECERKKTRKQPGAGPGPNLGKEGEKQERQKAGKKKQNVASEVQVSDPRLLPM